MILNKQQTLKQKIKTWLGKNCSTHRWFTDTKLVASAYTKHVILLRPILFHDERCVPDVTADIHPVLVRRATSLDDIVDVSYNSIVG